MFQGAIMPLGPSVGHVTALLQPIEVDLSIGPEALLTERLLRMIISKEPTTRLIQS
jgi:hypothetical protein